MSAGINSQLQVFPYGYLCETMKVLLFLQNFI